MLVQYTSFFRTPRRLYRCFPHLAAEIGDTVQLSLTEKGIIVNIVETYKRARSPLWQQEIIVTDLSPLS